MKASYRWITELVPGLKASAHEVAERLTGAGLEVEGVHEFGAGTLPVVIAEVRKVEPHPKREKLRLVTVDRGDGEQRVVCGAPNVPEPGGLVALAPLGATLPAVGMTLTPREIGGVISEGMLCSERELGLASVASKDEDPGIIVLPPGSARAGMKLTEALPGAHDWILDINVTPNRPDALGHIGIARDVAALFGLSFTPPLAEAETKARAAEGMEIADLVQITVDDTERCPHYGGAAVVDVTVGPSPVWLRYRLESLGIRSISNIVDITNLVLLLFGHPIHAFDLDLVRGKKIGVRRAAKGEAMVTLDGVTRKLTSDDLLIVDGEGPVALAGVMGGQNSEIQSTTKRVLIECAYFSPRGVRRTSRRYGLHTEASHRFERGVDPGDIDEVLAYTSALIAQLGHGSAVRGTIIAGAPPEAPKVFPLRSSRLDALLGVKVPFEEAHATLGRLGFTARPVAGSADMKDAAVFTVPTHRPDIVGEADLIEEVVRMRGLDAVPTVLPAIRPQAPRATLTLENRVRKAAVAVGLSEAITYGFVSPKELEALGLPKAPIALLNPLTEERSVMRTSLLPGLCEVLRRARRHGVGDVRVFNVGARFLAPLLAPHPNVAAGAAIEQSLGAPAEALPFEAPSFAAVIAGHRQAVLSKPGEIDVYDAKGVAVAIVERVTLRKAIVQPQPAESRAPYLHPRGAADVLVSGVKVGSFGPLHPDAVDALDLDGGCVVIELDLGALAEVGTATPRYRPIPVLPASTRDLAVVVSEDVTAGAVEDSIRAAGEELCESVELFDLFRGGQVPEGHKSLAFHVVYRDPKAASAKEAARTLTDEEVDTRHQRVVASVKEKFGATLRA